MALAAPASIRKQDVRGQLADSRVELAANRSHELTFIRRVRNDASVVIRLLTNDQTAEACTVLGGLVHASTRRLGQLAVDFDDEGTAA
jgi:hypothetical protein